MVSSKVFGAVLFGAVLKGAMLINCEPMKSPKSQIYSTRLLKFIRLTLNYSAQIIPYILTKTATTTAATITTTRTITTAPNKAASNLT